MKIAMISAYPPEMGGGSERYCFELSKRLAKRGCEVNILTSKLENQEKEEFVDGVKIRRFRWLTRVWGINPLSLIFSALLSENFDLVYAHSYVFFTSNQAALCKMLKRYPFILHIHGGVHVVPGAASKFKLWCKENLYDESLGKITISMADIIASVSKEDIDLLSKRFKIPRDKFVWIPNAVNTRLFKPEREEHSTPTIGFVGRLEYWKGIVHFVEIARRIHSIRKDVKFVVVGNGSLIEKCKRLSRDLPIIFLGHVPHDEMPTIYNQMTVLVLPSLTEGLPTSCIEAMSCEIPVITSKVGGLQDLVEDSFLCPPNNVEAFVKKTLTLLEPSYNRNRVGRQERIFVQKSFDWEIVANKVIQVLERVLDTGKTYA